MKTFFTKILLILASSLCMFEGLVLVAVGMGKLSPDTLVAFYNGLLATPKSMTTILAIGLFFVLIGFILLVVASRTKPAPRMIVVEKDGKALGIPQLTIKDFIKQIIAQNPYITDAGVVFVRKKSGVDIRIVADLEGVQSVHQELARIEDVLREELQSVFEWKDFDFNFELSGVKVNPKKKYFVQEGAPVRDGVKEAVEETPLANETVEAEQAVEAEEKQEEIVSVVKEKIRPKFKAKDTNGEKNSDSKKDSSLLSKLLWGK